MSLSLVLVLTASIRVGVTQTAVPLKAASGALAAAPTSSVPANPQPASTERTPSRKPSRETWRSRAELMSFENLEGIVLLQTKLHGLDGRDTSGTLVLDTGAGYVALDAQLARILGIDTTQTSSEEIEAADLPLPRLEVGQMQFDQVFPILTIDANIVRQVTDRPVLGLLGTRSLIRHAIAIDYRKKELGFIAVDGPDASDDQDAPTERIQASRAALGDALRRSATGIAFRLRGDGKILLSARVANPDPRAMSETLTLVLDTGATKTALFADALTDKAPRFERWPTLSGLTAPTLVGSADARLARVPVIEVLRDSIRIRATHVDVAVIDSPLAAGLSNSVGEPVHGLLGYSFLRRFRLVIDYPHRVLWLEPVPFAYDERPNEYTHVGIQLERRGASLRIVGLAAGAPAASAGIERGDEIVAIDGIPAAGLDVIGASRRLEGRAGTAVTLIVRRGESEKTYRLLRRRLL